MSHPFEMWSDRIAAADTDEARRALLVEAARWRAQHLTDVPATRRATFLVSRLHAMLGDRDRAVNEARQLLSLCQTAPEASGEEIEAARGYLQSLGESAPRLTLPRRERDRDRRERPTRERPSRDRSDRPERGERPTREAKRTKGADGPANSLPEARRAAAAGEWDKVLRLLDGARSAGAALVRTYAQLSAAAAGDAAALPAAVDAVRQELARAAGIGNPGAGRADDPNDPLAQLLGGPVPTRRAARIKAIEDFAAAHPDQIDALAAAALRQHVAAHGAGAPAPWLVGVVALATVDSDAAQTGAAVEELRRASAVAVQAYDEWPYQRLVRLMRRARAAGLTLGGMRRGVLSRGEPDDRKLWTLRVTDADGTERMLAVAPHATDAYPPGKAEELAARLGGLCARTLLLATGSGNAGLRQAAAADGLTVLDADGDDDAILAALAAAGPAARATPAADNGHAQAPDRLADLLRAESVDTAGLVEAIKSFRRPDRAMRIIGRLELDDAHTAAVLQAVDQATEADQTLPEATTLAIRAATAGGQTRALLEQPGSIADRFGGPDVGAVTDVASAVLGAGWELFRVLRGPTRRETTAHPALETLSSEMGGLWRLLVRQGDRRGEVWFVSSLQPEGRAGVPLLLLEDWQRVVVLPVDPELLAWWRSLGSPAPTVGWTGGEGREVAAAVDGFVAREPRTEGGGDAGEGASPAP
ncbi:MAG: hypothetical protein R3F59_29960 [Myxococcota bacterium]